MRVISPDERGTITIDAVRGLYKAARAKQESRQVIVIEDADGMSLEAENAFLKLLEEPRDGLTFILTTRKTESLLPTVLSRIQQITLQPLTDDMIRRFIMSKKPGIAQADLTQLVFLAQGRPGAAMSLLADNALPEQRERMQIVKHLVTAKPYERLSLIGKLASDRDKCIENLNAMMRIAEIQMSSASKPAQLEHWTRLAAALEDALTSITNNGNVRAQLLHLFTRY
jgi:DNA polymerase-3 subunit delta'